MKLKRELMLVIGSGRYIFRHLIHILVSKDKIIFLKKEQI